MNQTLLGFAVGCLILGLILNFASKPSAANYRNTNLASWVLIALFPAFLLFYFFPNSKSDASILGFTASGAVALFVFIVWYATTHIANVMNGDQLKKENDALRTENDDLKRERATLEPARKPKVITEVGRYPYRIRAKSGKKIVLVTGGIERVKYADIWVNSENTNMQMARFFDRSVSSVIRTLGAAHDAFGEITDDLVGKALADAVRGRISVPAAAVIPTDAGSLAQSHNVKRLFHVAAVYGELGGYTPVGRMQDCVANVFRAAEQEPNCRSIVFPILGAGTGRGDLAKLTNVLLVEIVCFFESDDARQIETAYVLTWTDVEFEMCKGILDGLSKRVEVVP